MRYCSYETRKVIESLNLYGVDAREEEYFDIEIEVGLFWNTHIQQVIEKVMCSAGDVEKKFAKITEDGWAYFKKPVRSMLTPRGAAHRTEIVSIWETARPFYNAITGGFLRADFNMKELALLCVEMPPMIADSLALSNAIKASGENRSLYYLHGIVRREHQSRQGRIREIQNKTDQHADAGWSPDPNFDKIDIIDRLELAADWQDKLNDLQINQALNRASQKD